MSFLCDLDHRNKIASFLEGNAVTTAITVLILINAVTLGMETDADIVSEFGGILAWLDRAILVIFSVEIALKLYVYRLGFSVQAGIFLICPLLALLGCRQVARLPFCVL